MLNIKNDSAFYYFNKVVASSTDSLQIAMAYNSMSAIQSDAGDYFGSQENLLMSLRYLNEKKKEDHYCLSSDYNELGTTSLNLKNYDAAIGYYDKALKFAQNDEFKLIFLNNKAVVYQKKKDFAKAIVIYDSIIDKSPNDKKNYARVLSNRARTRWLQDSGYHAAPELLRALQIKINEKDYWGQNASYAHLSDYYSHSRPDSALTYADKMYSIARYLDSPDDEMEALQKLISLGSPQNLQQYFNRYQYLNDSLQTSRNNAKNQFALIRYEAEKNKNENLQLQKENADNQLQIIRQRIMLYGTILAALSVIIISIFWYRKRQQQAQNTIRENQLKTSQKIHDVVANGLYRVMAEIEHEPAVGKEILLDKIEILYNQSRDISYEQPTASREDFQVEITNLLRSFATDTTKVLIVGNHQGLWNGTNHHIKKEVTYILQELMINMKKHSYANNVVIRFEQTGQQINIQYTDDGVGFPSGQSFGNGLTNTGTRIQNINGKITFDPNTTGTKIRISIPIG